MENREIALLIFGVASLYAPFDLGKDRRRRQRRTAQTMGRVIGHDKHLSSSYDGSRGVPTQHAIIIYQVRGKEYRCVASTGASWIIHPVGTSIQVCYDPHDPKNANIVASDFDDTLELAAIWELPSLGIMSLLYLMLKYVL